MSWCTSRGSRFLRPSRNWSLSGPRELWKAGGAVYVWLEQLIAANLESLFPGMEIVEAHPFHVTRDAEVAIQELESDDLLETIEEAVWRRRFRAVVRLQVGAGIPPHILDFLVENLESLLRGRLPRGGPARR